MDAQTLYHRLKQLDTELPNIALQLLKGCDDYNCECRQRVPKENAHFIDYLMDREQASQKALEGSMRAVRHNPHIMLLMRGYHAKQTAQERKGTVSETL